MTENDHDNWATAAFVIVLVISLATCQVVTNHDDDALAIAKAQLDIAKVKAGQKP